MDERLNGFKRELFALKQIGSIKTVGVEKLIENLIQTIEQQQEVASMGKVYYEELCEAKQEIERLNEELKRECPRCGYDFELDESGQRTVEDWLR